MKKGILILSRHHETDWNKEGKWQGITDTHLTIYGAMKSFEIGKSLVNMVIDVGIASTLFRTKETLEKILKGANKANVPIILAAELNERDYGDYTGMNKWEIREKVGEEEFKKIRRGWSCPIPGGETLEQVYDRAKPYFINSVVPLLNEGKNVLIVGHGNCLRAIVKYIENISNEKICDLDFAFGEVLYYTLDEKGRLLSKEIKIVESKVNA
jgi:2,3-bisphosphoglycerate-dependent phosphoglycerate mutase